MTTNAKLPKGLPSYLSSIFSPDLKKGIVMICQVLGYESDQEVHEIVLGIMASINPPTIDPYVKFNYCNFLAHMIDAQLKYFESVRTFRYQSHMSHLLLHQNNPYFDGYEPRMTTLYNGCSIPPS